MPDLARISQRCPPCLPHGQGTQPTPRHMESAVAPTCHGWQPHPPNKRQTASAKPATPTTVRGTPPETLSEPSARRRATSATHERHPNTSTCRPEALEEEHGTERHPEAGCTPALASTRAGPAIPAPEQGGTRGTEQRTRSGRPADKSARRSSGHSTQRGSSKPRASPRRRIPEHARGTREGEQRPPWQFGGRHGTREGAGRPRRRR